MEKSASHKLGDAFGFLFSPEIDLLRAVAGDMPEKGVFINVGVGVGTSSLTVAEVRPDVKIYSVDISEGGPYGGFQNEINAFRDARMLDRLPTQVLGCSWEVGDAWSREAGDVVMIDAGHLEEEVTKDITAWRRLVKKGGVMLFHDYDSVNWPAVKGAVDKNFGEKNGLLVKTLKAFRL